ncbi:MAG: HEAT repeat domain-containing protein [Planctomycetes bacterium]|nr:HEAT repeat domain-containing protein [Planctomycetota bacterium]
MVEEHAPPPEVEPAPAPDPGDAAPTTPAPVSLEQKMLEEPAFPVLIVQFFLVPLLIVVTCVGLYAGVRWLMGEERGLTGLVEELNAAKGNRKWQAAFELSRKLAIDRQANEPVSPEVVDRVILAYKEAPRDDAQDSVQLRRFLILALGNLRDPRAIFLLTPALDEEAPEIRVSALLALGNIGDAQAAPAAARHAQDKDPSVRKAVYYTLGLYGDRSTSPVLVAGLRDAADDVRWNAALALARMKDPAGAPVLREMLDRAALAKVVAQTEAGGRVPMREDNIEEVMINALNAVACIGDRSFEDLVARLGREDRSLKVRRAALSAQESLTGGK